MPAPAAFLDALRIATPCPVSWESMTGDDRKRFCSSCSLHVYDVSALTSRAAERLVRSASGKRLCLRLWRRADGRVVTRDCGRVRAAIARRTAWVRSVAAAVMAFFALPGCSDAPEGKQGTGTPVAEPPSTITPTTGIVAMPAPDPSATPRDDGATPEMGGVRAPGPTTTPDPTPPTR